MLGYIYFYRTCRVSVTNIMFGISIPRIPENMNLQEFADSLSKPQKYLLGFYAFCMLMLFLTRYLIANQSARVDELKELNRETWEL